MKLARIAGVGVTTALATAGLVGATTTTAHAAPVSSTYACTPTAGAPFNMPVAVDLALLPNAVAGTPVPAGTLGFVTTATIPGPVQTMPGGPDSLGVTGLRSADFGTVLGDSTVTAPSKWTKPVNPNVNGDFAYLGSGANSALVLPKAGTYTATLPKTFTFTGTNAGGTDTTYKGTCTTTTPATVGSITLSKQTAKVTAKAPKSVKKGTVVSVAGKVKAQYAKQGGPAATGKVVVKDGKKTVGKGKIKKGKFVVKVKGLAKGSHSLTVSYKGDGYVGKAVSKARSVTVS